MVNSAIHASSGWLLRTACLLLLLPGITLGRESPEQTVSLSRELLTQPADDLPASRETSRHSTGRNQGVTAGFLSYDVDANQRRKADDNRSRRYNLNYTLGFNAGAWRLRHNANARIDEEQRGYDVISSYAQHDLSRFNSRLTLGQYSTPAELFDGVDFSGVQLRSDEQMRPMNQRGYAPVVRGVARTSATVTVSQQGSVIYETQVPPGEFIIHDLQAPKDSGDLDVVVSEADGSNHHFTVPYLTQVDLLRPGNSRYSFSLGRLREQQHVDGPWFGQSTWRHGVNNYSSLYTGGVLAEGYTALTAGSAAATPFGALSADITSSTASDMLDDDGTRRTLQGESYRLGYSHHLSATDTSLALAAYRFSNEDYVSLDDFAWQDDDDGAREQNRFQLTVSQPVGSWGQLDLSGTGRHYWDSDDQATTYQLGYRRDFNWGNLYLSASQDIKNDEPSSLYLASVTLPLGLASQSPDVTASSSFGSEDPTRFRTSIGDEFGAAHQANYQVHASLVGEQGTQLDDYGANLQWKTPATLFGINASREGDGNQYSGSLSGTLLAHSGGLLLSPNRGETMVLVQPRHGRRVRTSDSLQSYISASSDALMAGLTPYQANNIEFDTTRDNRWHLATREVIPTQGAIIVIHPDDYPQEELELYEEIRLDTNASDGSQ